MMTLEEVWENLRQDPEIKATMEEAEKSYKLFKKIENLIVADLEAKLTEKEKEETKRMEDFEKGCQEYYKSNQTAIAELEKVLKFMKTENELGFKKSAMETFMFIDQQINDLRSK